MKVYVLNTLGIGLDTIEILSESVRPEGVIGLSDRPDDDKMSDFVYQKEFCERNGLNFIQVGSYDLSKKMDKAVLEALEIDVLLVVGWQRLIPKWLIDRCSICAIGSHGSPLGITKGRGRSPQNWALILGAKEFYISIFKIDPGIDSGQVINTRKFTYSEFDTIKTSYYKVCLLTAEMTIEALRCPQILERSFELQDHDAAEYLPQRLPEDGFIDWECSNSQIRNLIRALTNPYPGALSSINGNLVKIWSAVPFELDIFGDYRVGEIIHVFNKNDILVKTKEGFLLIDHFEVFAPDFLPQRGMIFESRSFKKQFEKVIERHVSRNPNLPLSSAVLEFYSSVEQV